MSDNKLLSDFLASQKQHMQMPSAPPKKSMRTDKRVMQPGKDIEVEDGFAYIISKKPKPKKVSKYLQGMVDDIMADMDN